MTNLNQNNHCELNRIKPTDENEKLKAILKNAVNSEKVPERLKERIAVMLRIYDFTDCKKI
jgi:hypothetical protein